MGSEQANNTIKKKEPVEAKALPTGIKSIPGWIWIILIAVITIMSFSMNLLSTRYPTYYLIILAVIVVVSLIVFVIYAFYRDRKTLLGKCNTLVTEYNQLVENYNILDSELKAKKDALEKTQQELATTKDKLTEREKEVVSCKHEITGLNKLVQDVKTELEKNKNELKTALEKLSKKENELAETREKFTVAEDELKRKNEYIGSLEKELTHRRTAEVKPIFSSGVNSFSHWLAWTKYKLWIMNVGTGPATNVVGKCTYHTNAGDFVFAVFNGEIIKVGQRIVVPSQDELANNKDFPQGTGMSVEFTYKDVYGNSQMYRRLIKIT